MKLELGLLLFKVRGLVFIHNPCIISFSTYVQKCLFVKSGYCDFNWWNSWLGFDVMTGYVKLMIIELLMMKLHAQDVYICILCWFCSIWWKKMMLWLLNDGEIMIIWCRCCCVMMFSSIYALGVDESIVVILQLLWKWVDNEEVWFWWCWMS